MQGEPLVAERRVREVADAPVGQALPVRANGLVLEGPTGVHRVTPWIATDDPTEVGEVDAIIFGVKGDGLEAAGQACRPMIGPNTVVIPFLNG